MSRNSAKQTIECLQGWMLHMEADRKRKGVKVKPKKLDRNEG